MVAFAQKNGKEPLTDFQCFPHRIPLSLRKGDNRFHPTKHGRTYACDNCGMLVRCSRAKDGTGFRWQSDFHGAYQDKSWAGLPVCFYEDAWNLGLIDLTWNCEQYCDGGITGGRENRFDRTQFHEDRLVRKRQRGGFET